MYNIVYSKKALNIYTFAFVHEYIEKEKEQKIKDLLCAMYLYISKENTGNDIVSLKDIILETKNVESLDELLVSNEVVNKIYEFFPIHEQLKKPDVHCEYEEALKAMKEEFTVIDIVELEKFINTIESIDELYEKIYDGKMTKEELQQMDSEIESKLDYLDIYMSKDRIDMYRTYFNARNGDLNTTISRLAANTVDDYKGETDFSELLQIDCITDKVATADNLSNLVDIELKEEEQSNINKYVGIKLLETLLFIVVLGILLASFFNVFRETNLNTYLIPISILSIITLLVVFNLIKYVVVLFENKKMLKGGIGFVAHTEFTKKGCKYKIYLPKYNEKCAAMHKNVLGDKGILHIRKSLKIGSMVKVVKTLGLKFIIPFEK